MRIGAGPATGGAQRRESPATAGDPGPPGADSERSGGRPVAPRIMLRAPRRRLSAVFALGIAVLLLASFAKPGFRGGPRTPELVAKILSEGPHDGACDRCHTPHGEDTPIAYEHALIGPDDNTLCDGCHVEPWSGGSYPGASLYGG